MPVLRGLEWISQVVISLLITHILTGDGRVEIIAYSLFRFISLSHARAASRLTDTSEGR